MWLNGLTYRAVTEKTGVSLGAMNGLVNEARKKAPDIDDLRRLNAALQKSGVAVVDATRGAKLLDRVNELGIDLAGLEKLLGLIARLSSERNVEADKFVDSALRLTELEAKTGKPYQEVVREFEDKQAQLRKLDLKVRELDSQRVKIQGELSQANEKLSKTQEELKHAIDTKERLQRLGLEKTAALAEFVENYELLGFSVEEVQEIAELKKELDAEGIRIGTLRQHFKSTRALKQKCQAIQMHMKSEETKLKLLTRMRSETERNIRDLQSIQRVLQSRTVSFPCAFCGATTLKEIRNFEAQQALTQGAPIVVACGRCGQQNFYNPIPTLLNLALQVLS